MPQDYRKEIMLQAKTGGNTLKLVIRTLSDYEDYHKFMALEKEIWGEDFSECVPTSMLFINQKVGGLSAGAFDANGRMHAMIYGLTGPREGYTQHWSHLMGVAPPARAYGLGREMKLFQREFLLRMGVKRVLWTFDPLESKNAHLNMNHLGALPVAYDLDVYGPGSGGLHSGIGTDRYTVGWDIASKRVKDILDAPLSGLPENHEAPIVNTTKGNPSQGDFSLPDVPFLRIEIPVSIQEAKLKGPGMGKSWRMCTRRAFTHYMGGGYKVTHFFHRQDENRSYYMLRAPGANS